MALYDVVEYTTLRRNAIIVQTQLKAIRKKIREMETVMVSEVKRTNTPITYTSDNSQMCLHVKERTRWFALTRSDLMGKLYECLKDRFGQVKHEELQDFVLKIVNGLWGGRRTKKEIRLCSKKV